MRLLFLSGLLLAGCATLDAASCGSANWYDIGFRDGIFAIQPQDGIYQAQCSGGINLARYSEGFRDGKAEYENRKRVGGHD